MEQGSADATLLKGEWEFEYFAYSPNGKRIKKNDKILDSGMHIKDICNRNTSGWSKGTYVCSLYIGKKLVGSERIVVE